MDHIDRNNNICSDSDQYDSRRRVGGATKGADNPKNFVQSAAKVFAVLQSFDAAPPNSQPVKWLCAPGSIAARVPAGPYAPASWVIWRPWGKAGASA